MYPVRERSHWRVRPVSCLVELGSGRISWAELIGLHTSDIQRTACGPEDRLNLFYPTSLCMTSSCSGIDEDFQALVPLRLACIISSSAKETRESHSAHHMLFLEGFQPRHWLGPYVLYLRRHAE